MPVVPTKDNFETRPTVAPGVRFQNTQSLGEARLPGQQLEEFGRAQTKAGETAAAIALDIQAEANALRVDDALNQARETAMRLQHDKDMGFENLKGFDALNRPNGKPLADEYGENLARTIDELTATLGNDAQKTAFAAKSKDLLISFKGNALQHEGAQFREYSKSVREGTIKNRIQNIALNYDKPEVIAEDIVSIQANAKDLARQLGKAAVWGEAAAREQTSAAHMVVIETALQKENVKYADDYFKKYASQMEPNDILRVNAVLGGELDNQLAVQTAGKVIESQINNIVTPDSDRAFNIALGTESNNMQFGGPGSVAGPNEPTTSPAGAIGIAQVMPGTAPEAAKLAGLEWDEDRYKNDAAYNRALGKAYFEKQLKDFNGSLAQAYAAYNAGPGATREAIKKAEAEGDAGAWLSYLPAETQNYVKKNMNAFGAGAGANKTPTLYELQQAVRAEIGEENPKRLRLALDEVERRRTEIVKAQEEAADRGVADAMREILTNGGNYASLPPNIRSQIPPDKVTEVMDFAKKVATGDDTTNMVLYNQLTENPENLAGLSDDQFIALRSELSETDFKHFAQERAKILNGTQAEGQNPGSLNTTAINTAVNNRLAELGISAEDDPQRVGLIRQFVNKSILAAQTANGKHMNDAEIESFIDQQFTEHRVTYYSFWGDTTGPLLGIKTNQIPKQDKQLIKDAYRKLGVDNPTDQEVLESYWLMSKKRATQQRDKGTF